jgi:hypothetical protein
MPPRIVVDADDLDYLREVLWQAKHELEQLATRISVYEAALGSDHVRRGVNRVISNWSDVREKVTTEMESLAGLLEAAANEYRNVEQGIVTEARGEQPLAFPDIAGG